MIWHGCPPHGAAGRWAASAKLSVRQPHGLLPTRPLSVPASDKRGRAALKGCFADSLETTAKTSASDSHSSSPVRGDGFLCRRESQFARANAAMRLPLPLGFRSLGHCRWRGPNGPSRQSCPDERRRSRNILCVNRNHLFRSIRLRFAHNTLPTQRNLPNWLVRKQLMEAIKTNLLGHQIGSFNQSVRGPGTGRAS